MMFRQEFLLLACTLVFNIPTKTLQPLELHADLLETTRLEKGNFSKSHSYTRSKKEVYDRQNIHLTKKARRKV